MNAIFHPSKARSIVGCLASIVAVQLSIASLAVGQLNFESAPINYDSAPTTDRVQLLAKEIERGDRKLSHDRDHGYLKSVLDALDVPVESQMLVFSKTSFQQRRISPRRPRAVYFNDDVYIGWVQGGDVLEFSSADPHQGAVFYTMSQEQVERPKIIRDRGQCISCHASSRTSGVPGHVVRSVYASESGQPYFGSGTFTTDHRSPFKERWGGWYVSGTHGDLRHMGNVIAIEEGDSATLDIEAGANVTDLSTHLDTEPYLSSHSDIVALMVLEHQSRMHNLITRANFDTRLAQHYDQIMNKAMDRPAGYVNESRKRRVDSAAAKLVEYLLFGDEFQLAAPVSGSSSFTANFEARGPRDSQGRSLRDFDLETRMMKYPCSYLIYSAPFDGMPDEVKDRVYRRLYDVLTSKDESETFAHLSKTDRQSILEILRETKPGLPDYWDQST